MFLRHETRVQIPLRLLGKQTASFFKNPPIKQTLEKCFPPNQGYNFGLSLTICDLDVRVSRLNETVIKKREMDTYGDIAQW